MWFGTSEGLVRFDGVDYDYYTIENGLYDNNITAICQDNKNNIWIGDKRGGISIFNNDTIHLFDPEEGIPSQAISYIYVDSKNTLWFSTDGEGVYYYEKKSGRLKNLWEEEGVSDYVYCTEEDNKGNIWIGTDKGIVLFNIEKNAINTISESNGLPDNIVKYIEFSNNNSMRIGMENRGIIDCDVNTYEFSNPVEINNFSLNNFVSNNKKEIWISTVSKGIIRINTSQGNNNLQHYTVINGVLRNKTNKVFIDRENNLWIGFKNGIAQCSLNSFEFIRKENGLTFDIIYSLLETPDNKQWFCTEKGLFLSQKNKLGKILLKNIFEASYPKTVFISLFYDNNGFVWAGTYNEGVFKINIETLDFEQFTKTDGLSDNNIIAITGNDSLIYFSTLGGGVSYIEINSKNSNFRTFNTKNGLKSNYIYQTFIDSKNRLWFAQDGGGLCLYEKGNFINFDENYGLTAKTIYGIAEDEYQNIWCISENDGIFRYNGERFKKNNINSELKSSSYSGIIYLGNDELLLISNEGLEVMNVRNGIITFYGEESGVAFLDPNLNSVFKDTNNNILIGTNKGIIKCNFEKIEQETIKPLLLITKKQTYFHDINKDSVVLAYNDNHLIFNYTGFWFKSPEKLQYRHKLVGFDLDWIYSKNAKGQTYSNLPPGKYTFIVEVSHIQDVWIASKNAVFSFQIKPPFWETWWFITFSIFIILFGAYSFFKYRLRKLTKAKENLETEVKKRTAKIMKQKQEIEIQNQSIRQSIDYASKIQTALIDNTLGNNAIAEHFIFWQPKDVVSGDFYWIKDYDNRLYYIAADCTGHGVPGAFMSMLGISFLEEIIFRKHISKPSEILNSLRSQIKQSLRQSGKFSKSKDGMDMAICIIDKDNLKMQYAGAYNPLYLVRNNEFIEIKATRNPVGIYLNEIPFANNEIQLQKGDIFYIFSDGFYDQFGGEKGGKYTSKRFKKFIIAKHKEPINKQTKIFENEFARWTSNTYSQIDDVLIVGVKLT